MAQQTYVAIAYTDASGEHAMGEEVTFEDDAAVEGLLRYGILTLNKPERPPTAQEMPTTTPPPSMAQRVTEVTTEASPAIQE